MVQRSQSRYLIKETNDIVTLKRLIILLKWGKANDKWTIVKV